VARPAKTLLAYLEEHPALQFHEAVVGYRIREVALEVDADEVKVVVLEFVECAKMEHNQNRHNLAVLSRTGVTTANVARCNLSVSGDTIKKIPGSLISQGLSGLNGKK